jgi:hypothetical protein
LHGDVHVYDSPSAIRVLRAEAGDVLDGGQVVPGLAIPLRDVFGPPEDQPVVAET